MTFNLRIAASILAALALGGCANVVTIPNPLSIGNGIIHVETAAKPANSVVQRGGQPVVLRLQPIAEARTNASGRQVGRISATVIDMAATQIQLDEDVTTAVAKALSKQLAAEGLGVGAEARSDFNVEATVKEFLLDIVDRDELSIVTTVAVRDAQTGEVIWSGEVAERSSRFAGVAGNSRASIVAYVDKGLGAWASKAATSIRDNLLKSFPKTLSLVDRQNAVAAPALEGVTTTTEARMRDAATATTPAVGGEPVLATPKLSGPEDSGNVTGTISIVTAPPRAKVYVGDVYFGLTPLKLALDPGIATVRLKLDGFKNIEEKVSIRRGETTELEVKFEK